MPEIAEPHNGTMLYWPGRDADEIPLLILRDDDLADAWGNGDAHWFNPGDSGDPLTWDELTTWVEDEEEIGWDAALLVPIAAGKPAVPQPSDAAPIPAGR